MTKFDISKFEEMVKDYKTNNKFEDFLVKGILYFMEDVETMEDIDYIPQNITDSLPYYTDTNKIFNKYTEEIRQIVAENEDNLSFNISIEDAMFDREQTIQHIVWFSIEFNASEIINTILYRMEE